jgi:opacity protein-like surface antigen
MFRGMTMVDFRTPLAGALMLAGLAAPAVAADLYEAPVVEAPVAIPQVGGWYLRGYVGMSNQDYDGLDYEYFDEPGFTQTWLDDGGFDSAPLGGVGIGYAFNNWLRGDVTAEFRGKSSFYALDAFTSDATGALAGTNSYTATKSEWLLLANAYVDLGEYRGISPYVGAGIGASRNTISHFNDTNAFAAGGGFAPKHSQWELAWALHAGLGYAVTDRLTMDLGYSYVNLGDAKTGDARNYDPAFTRANDGFTFKDLSSHDIKLGIRYKFN